MNAKETIQSVKLFPTKRYITSIFHVTMLLLFLVLASGCGKDAPIPILEQEQDPKEQGSIDIVPQEQDPQEQESSDPSTQNDIELVDSEVLYFMANYNIPGAAIAVSIDEKMVYSKGYGFANVEQNIATKADDVFRIASISKPFTSTAIMKLVDEGKLSLSDFVFGSDGILGDDFGTAELTEDELKITVDHLMIHGAGGWSVASGGDPIDYEPQLESNDFIEYVLNNWDLTTEPGTSFAYSNTGYWLLARIVEKVSDQTFEDYVRALVSPTGITSFKTTEFTREDREANEVEYYGSPEDEQYIYSIASRRDGDGGIVISAPDLLRFICALDGRPNRQDLVSTSSLEIMSQPSELSNLGRGLATWPEQSILYFTGSLPGTRSWFYMETANGVNAVILLNYRSSDPQFDLDFNNLVTNLVKDTSVPWQTDLDLF